MPEPGRGPASWQQGPNKPPLTGHVQHVSYIMMTSDVIMASPDSGHSTYSGRRLLHRRRSSPQANHTIDVASTIQSSPSFADGLQLILAKDKP
jgi:hypothetical protein